MVYANHSTPSGWRRAFLYSLFHSNSARIVLKVSSAMAFRSFVPRTFSNSWTAPCSAQV